MRYIKSDTKPRTIMSVVRNESVCTAEHESHMVRGCRPEFEGTVVPCGFRAISKLAIFLIRRANPGENVQTKETVNALINDLYVLTYVKSTQETTIQKERFADATI